VTLPTLSLTSWAGLAAAAAMVGTSWRAISGWFAYLSTLVICRVAVKDEASRAVMSLAWQKGRRSPFGVRVFGGTRTFVSPKKRVEVVGYETFGQVPRLCWFGRVPVLISNGHGGDQSNTYDGMIGVTHLWCIRGTLDLDAFVEEALVSFNQLSAVVAKGDGEKPRRRFNVHRVGRRQLTAGSAGIWSNGVKEESPKPAGASEPSDILRRLQHNELRLITWTPNDLIEQSNDAPPFDLYPFPAKALSLLPEIDRWLRFADWFRARGIGHRRGYLLTGKPGTGKSTFVKSVAIRFDLPLYVFDLASLDNQSFAEEWRNVQQNAPAIILLEDIDNVFCGRDFCAKVSAQRDPMTFDCLLNTISGVGSSDGILLFITTNHPETLDPALGVCDANGQSSRPGRIDRVIELGPMEEPERRKLATFILSDTPEDVDSTVRAGEGETAAQFQERCSQLTQVRWEERAAAGKLDGESYVPPGASPTPRTGVYTLHLD
jgi:chaperone BCS1